MRSTDKILEGLNQVNEATAKEFIDLINNANQLKKLDSYYTSFDDKNDLKNMSVQVEKMRKVVSDMKRCIDDIEFRLDRYESYIDDSDV